MHSGLISGLKRIFGVNNKNNISNIIKFNSINTTDYQFIQIDVSDFKPGKINISISIHDLIANRTVSTSLEAVLF